MFINQAEELELLIKARYPLIYVISWDERRIEEMLRGVARQRRKRLFTWTVIEGIVAIDTMQPTVMDPATVNPMQALEYITESREAAIFLFKDFHTFLVQDFISDGRPDTVRIVRKLRDLARELQRSEKTLIFLSPLLRLPPELEKDINVLDFALPSLDELNQALERVIRSARARIPGERHPTLTEEERERVLKAAQGLTISEAEKAFTKSVVMRQSFDLDVIIAEKKQLIRKSGILEYTEPNEHMKHVGGLDELKGWLAKRRMAFNERARQFGLPEPRGLLLLGVPGGGKSLVAKATASLWQLPLLRLDMGKVFSQMVGSSEENIRSALRLAETVAPCLDGASRITLADGSARAIQSIYDDATLEELTVLGMDDDFNIVPVAVRAVTRRPAPNLCEVRLIHARLRATRNHLHPTLQDGKIVWKRTDELTPRDHVAVTIPSSLSGGTGPSKDSDRTQWDADPIPVGQLLRLAREEIGMPAHEFTVTHPARISCYESNVNLPSRLHLQSIVSEMRAWAQEQRVSSAALDRLERLACSPIGWSKVMFVKPVEKPDCVYDLACKGNHTFVANGVVTHNCVLWLDEIEKGLAGTISSHRSDAGTAARVFGSFLVWLQEKTAPVFVIATSNNIHLLPPELLRKGRFDEIFFVDLPSLEEREEIFGIHLAKRHRAPDQFDLAQLAREAEGFSGAEIEQVIIAALYDAFDDGERELTPKDLLRAIAITVPLSRTMREQVTTLRNWARTHARQASQQPQAQVAWVTASQ
jgi:SpoVK/Ycf46/Vps4 family AAA+-type ATPase